jgi:hypothetical protein
MWKGPANQSTPGTKVWRNVAIVEFLLALAGGVVAQVSVFRAMQPEDMHYRHGGAGLSMIAGFAVWLGLLAGFQHVGKKFSLNPNEDD